MAALFIIILVLYILIISAFIIGFNKVKTIETSSTAPQISFSIIIPFRNESEHLPSLLASISQIDYPISQFELIFIDDFSEDDSVDIINERLIHSELNYTIIKNNPTQYSPKKEAIGIGVHKANFEWIITTDADCVLPRNWLLAFNSIINTNAFDMIIAPVTYTGNASFFYDFQLLDVLSLQSITIGGYGLGSPILCNGANFAYTKSAFKKLKGFEGNSKISSGDDIFFLHKMVKHNKESIGLLKSTDALVKTVPQTKLKDLIQQRLRWASKSPFYTLRLAKLVALIVLLMNLSLIVLPFALILQWVSLKLCLILFLGKLLVDAVCIYQSASFFNQDRVLLSYGLAAIVYPIFTLGIGLASLFMPFKWKNRTYNK